MCRPLVLESRFFTLHTSHCLTPFAFYIIFTLTECSHSLAACVPALVGVCPASTTSIYGIEVNFGA